MILGLVLAGGRSLRFGSNKALASLGGRTLLEIAATRLGRVCAETAVSAPDDGPVAVLARELGLTVLEDPAGAPRGPLSGVLAGLEWAQSRRASLLLTLPCDAPLLPDDLEPRLIAAAEGAVAAVARTPGGLQPLCAGWTPGMTRALRSALAHGTHPPAHQVLTDAGAAEVAFAGDEPFINVNTPQEMAEAARRLASAIQLRVESAFERRNRLHFRLTRSSFRSRHGREIAWPIVRYGISSPGSRRPANSCA